MSSAKSVRSFKGKARSFTGDRAKRPMGMKARLARSLAVFARREQRNQVWDDASVNLVEGFRVSSFSSRVLAVTYVLF